MLFVSAIRSGAQSFKLPVLLDDKELTIKTDVSISFMKEGKYTPMYLGELRDSLHVVYERFKYGPVPPPPPPPIIIIDSVSGDTSIDFNNRYYDFKEPSNEPNFYYEQYQERTSFEFYNSRSRPPFLKNDVEIWVDDKTLLNYTEEIRFKDTTISGQGYPVYIYNKSNDSLQIGVGRHLSLILYAKNTDGNWQPIETIYKYTCGTGLSEIAIYPNEIALTMVPKHSGTYKTQMRLVMDNNVSNAFVGSINIKQFTYYTKGVEPPQISKWQLFKMRFAR